MNIRTLDVQGIDIALNAMRNPLESYDKSGIEQDLELSRRLYRAGGEHSKHLRLIKVWMEVTAPRYWWQEMDTYKHIEKVSRSTMHKLLAREVVITDFMVTDGRDYENLQEPIRIINNLRADYLITKDDEMLLRAKRMLPESYLQTRTLVTNYQQLANMHHQRKNHRLKEEWGTFCQEILDMKLFRELTGI